jgi:hypothetical protein
MLKDMSKLNGSSSIVCSVLELIGIPIKNLREVHIHIMPDDVVKADCIYFPDITDENTKILENLQRNFHLHFEEFLVNDKKEEINVKIKDNG